jgi:hypothetical protein
VSDTEGGIVKNVEYKNGSFSRLNKDGVRWGVKLKDAVAHWPTPHCMDVRTDVRKPEERSDRANQGGCSNLREKVHMYPTPRSAIGMDMKLTEGMAELQHKKYLETEIAHIENAPGGHLNPDWTEWLMGWPVGWTNLEPLPLDTYEKFVGYLDCYWDEDPADLGVLHRITDIKENRTQRLKAIGNGQVPLCLVFAWNALISYKGKGYER